MMTRTLLKSTIIVTILSLCQSANILYVIPFTAKSHYIMLSPLGLRLAKDHNVTVITPYEEKNAPPSYHQVLADNTSIWETMEGGRPNIFDVVHITPEMFLDRVLFKAGTGSTEIALKSKNFQNFLQLDNKFDVVICSHFFLEATYMLAHKYKAPLILVTTFGNSMKQNILVKNPLQLSTVLPEFMPIENPDSFWGRFLSLYYSIYEYYWWVNYHIPNQEKLIRKYMKNLEEPVPSLIDVQRNAALILINGHFSYDVPTAYLPNIVEVGGLHLYTGMSPLSKDLKMKLDNAKQGVIYVNFGSNVRSSELPKDKVNTFLNVFRKLNETVLWKWEDDHLPNKPDNVITMKWMPQKQILAHPNVKVCISHGGLIGTQEAIFNGVPIIGIPIYADQYNNLLQAQKDGYGKVLKFNDINEETLEKYIKEALSDEFKSKAKEMSTRFKDRPMNPLETAVFWVEYVIRHKGAEFMKSPAFYASWIEFSMVDVYGFILVVLVTILMIIYITTKFIVTLLRGKSEMKISSKKKVK